MPWVTLLRELVRSVRAEPATPLPLGWALHTWATDQFDSVAIRSDGTEGLIGRAPARWRLVCHVDGPGYAVAVLDGRSPLRPANVLASLLIAPDRPAVITARDAAVEPVVVLVQPGAGDSDAGTDRQGLTTPAAALAGFVDLALGRCARVSGSATAVPPAIRLAASLALEQRGMDLAWTAPPRRGALARPRGFVGSSDPIAIRRQLLAVEAALRKRDRSRRSGA